MQIKKFRDRFLSELTPVYDAIEAEQFFNMLSEEYLSMKRVDVAMNPERELSDSELAVFESALAQLHAQIPIQYIIGKAHFFGLDFTVNTDVLIPRPETEELVEWIISDYEFAGSPKMLDIGTGSGCIPIALKANLKDAQLSAIDVSEKALQVAVQNAESNGVTVQFILSDVLKTESLNEQYDVIVSNPPYVRELEKREMRANVLENEPHLALFVADDDALVFYRKIADLAIDSLSENGRLYFEINQYLGKETVELLRNKGFADVELRQDIYGNDRMVSGSRKDRVQHHRA